MESLFPIMEFDTNRKAIFEPYGMKLDVEIPRRGVLCFFHEVLKNLEQEGKLKKIGRLASEIGENPIYQLDHQGETLMVFHPGVGAPLAAGFLEELIASGVCSFLACGGCGVLMPEIAVGHAVILTSAVRDEGTSYHYLPPSREVNASPECTKALEEVFQEKKVPYNLGKAWTTDGLYRETPARRLKRIEEGCSVVEMEAAAFFAVAQFRSVQFGQVVYGGDLVVPDGWDDRGWDDRVSDRENLFWLTVEACARL
jgi:uridine phosphorylase